MKRLKLVLAPILAIALLVGGVAIAAPPIGTALQQWMDQTDTRLAALEDQVNDLSTSTTSSTTTTTTLVVEPTTTTTAPTTTTTTAPVAYGAAGFGPDFAPFVSEGQIRTSVSNLPTSGVVLLRGGTYGSFTIPAGVTVMPYQKEHVQINGTVSFNDNSKLIGVHGNGGTSWFARPNSTTSNRLTGAVIDYSDLTGNGFEVIRASRNVELDILNSKIVGGSNHGVKYHGEGSAWKPSGKIVNTWIGSPQNEDGFQAEGAGAILLSRNTFDGAPENNIDLKTGTVTTEFADFLRSTQGNYLCHGNAVCILRNSKFGPPNRIELGSNNTGMPTLIAEDLTLVGTTWWLKQSQSAVLRNINQVGGRIEVGQATRGFPAETRIEGGRYENVTLVRQPGAPLFVSPETVIIGGSGW